MINSSEQENRIKKLNLFRWAIFLQCLLASAWLLLLPGEAQNAQFLGYSFRRLALLIPINAPLILAFLLNRGLRKNGSAQAILQHIKKNNKAGSIVVISCGLLAGILWSVIFLYHFLRIFGDIGFYVRLLPLMTNYLLLSLEIQLIVIHLFLDPIEKEKGKRQIAGSTFLAVFFILFFSALLTHWTGWGHARNRLVIVSLGVPLLEGQVAYIVGLLLIILSTAVAWHAVPRKKPLRLHRNGDILIFLLLWSGAVALWASQPLPDHNYFAPSERERAPNFEKYPFSDAEQYDYNSLYLLHGTTEDFVISKPLYVSFLTILHAIAGLDYSRVVFLQTLVIALFPGILYLIGRELHSRLGGIAMALFSIFRELNSIQASTMANVSNTKLLLSEGLAALLMSLLAYVLIRWFKSSGKSVRGQAFLAGGITGALILTRLQTMALVPFLMLLVIFRYWRSLRSICTALLILLLGCGLVLTPVLVRNYKITGVLWVDNPASSGRLYRYYTLDTGLDIEIPAAETQAEQVQRNISVMTQALVANFGNIADLVMDNFMRNEASSFLVMPIRLGNAPALMDMLMIQEPFWAEFYSQPNFLNALVFLIHAVLLALGFSAAFKNHAHPTLVFLGLHLVYSLSSALVRLSGWRFIQPADWMLYAFYALGLVEGVRLLAARWTRWPGSPTFAYWLSKPQGATPSSLKARGYVLFGMLFLLAGGFIPLREALFPRTVPQYTREAVCAKVEAALQESPSAGEVEDFEAYCLDPKTPVLMGYGIYPRFFDVGEGYYDRPSDLYFGKQDFSRLVFRVVGEPNGKVSIRTDVSDINFPNGSTVYVVGGNNAQKHYVLIDNEAQEFIVSAKIQSDEQTLN